MKTAWLALFGWLVPGGSFLLMRRYLPFVLFAAAVWTAFGAGLALRGGVQWPTAADLSGTGAASLAFQAVAAGKVLAGGPYLVAWAAGAPGTFLEGRFHEYGATLLLIAGLINALGVGSALDSRKEQAR